MRASLLRQRVCNERTETCVCLCLYMGVLWISSEREQGTGTKGHHSSLPDAQARQRVCLVFSFCAVALTFWIKFCDCIPSTIFYEWSKDSNVCINICLQKKTHTKLLLKKSWEHESLPSSHKIENNLGQMVSEGDFLWYNNNNTLYILNITVYPFWGGVVAVGCWCFCCCFLAVFVIHSRVAVVDELFGPSVQSDSSTLLLFCCIRMHFIAFNFGHAAYVHAETRSMHDSCCLIFDVVLLIAVMCDDFCILITSPPDNGDHKINMKLRTTLPNALTASTWWWCNWWHLYWMTCYRYEQLTLDAIIDGIGRRPVRYHASVQIAGKTNNNNASTDPM